MALFLAHTIILLGASHLTTRTLLRLRLEQLLAAGLLAWGNLVVTSLLLAALHHLGDPAWFFRTSVVLALATWFILGKMAPEPVEIAPGGDGETHINPLLLAAFSLTLAPMAYAGIRIAVTYVPNNYDTLTYHLPRAMYYLGQNSLAHFDTSNPRQIYFPFNYNLLQLFGLIYSPPVQVVNFFNLAAWAGAGLAIYRLCRLSAVSANAALIATWLALTSTQVLAQATATTNDLPTGTGLLCVLVFVLRWRKFRRTRDAYLAGLAAGLTAGSKLTVIFFGPAAGVIVLALAYQHWRSGAARQFFLGLRSWLAPGLLAFTLASPFALINLAEKGQWINKTYDFTLNRPFSLACAGQTAAAYLVQLFIEPLHRFAFDMKFTAELNTWGAHTFFPHWNDAYAFSPLLLFPPDLNEDHVWFGFTGPVIILAVLGCLVRWRKVATPVLWLAALGLGWFATYFLLNKWSLYNQRYFVPAIMVLSPSLAVMIEAGWTSPRWQRGTRAFLSALALCALWLTGVYLFANTSRPYAPLWAGDPPPPALPTLPALMTERLAAQSRINIDSTDGNERIFLLMALGRHQHFTSFEKPDPAAYNVFSQWGFVRKVAYTNIEQLSTYTLVEVPTKPTAGVEFLGTIGQGQPAQDYYGLAPHPELAAATPGNRNILVTLYYIAKEPHRYDRLRIRVTGLNAPDHARLLLGVVYDDHSAETLSTFTTDGEAPAAVTRPFHHFTVRVEDQPTGKELGAINIPHIANNRSPDEEAPFDPSSLFSDELVALEPKSKITTTGLAQAEGPYAQWDLPIVRWAKAPVVRLEIPATEGLDQLELKFSLRPQARETAIVDVVFNGVLVNSYPLNGRTQWFGQKIQLTPKPGPNILEFRNVSVGTEPDWLEYLERYPDVKNYVISQNIPLAQGGRDHYETHGRKEGRILNRQHKIETIESTDSLYYVFRYLRLEGYKKP